MFVKNNSGVSKTWVGQVVANLAYYQIQDYERSAWSNNSLFIIDISNADAVMATDDSGSTDIADVNNGINYLKSIDKKDLSGRIMVREAAAIEGSSYLSLHLYVDVFKEAPLIRAKDHKAASYLTTHKYFDAEEAGNELVTPTQATLDASAKRMEFTIDFAKEFEVVKGQILSGGYCPYLAFLDVVAGLVSLGENYVGSFVEGLCLKHITNYASDGRVSKLLPIENPAAPGVPANVFKGTVKRPTAIAGAYDFSMNIELFRL